MQNVVSSDGYVSFNSEDIDGLDFRIKVKKTEIVQGMISHFTILAPTEDSVVRLEPTIMHYEILEPSKSKEYIF